MPVARLVPAAVPPKRRLGILKSMIGAEELEALSAAVDAPLSAREQAALEGGTTDALGIQGGNDMADESTAPIGRFDHIGIAVHSIERARAFFEGALGATHRKTVLHASGDFRLGLFDLHDFCIELLEPVNPEGFLAKFLERRGEGFHHLTLQTPDLETKTVVLEEQGVRIVDKSFDNPESIDAFISPKSAHGLLIQLGQTLGPLNNRPYWEADDA